MHTRVLVSTLRNVSSNFYRRTSPRLCDCSQPSAIFFKHDGYSPPLLGSHSGHLSACKPHHRQFSSVNLIQSDGIISNPWDKVDIPEEMSLAEYLFSDMERYGNSIALIDGLTGRKVSYNELLDNIRRVASAFSRIGLFKGDVITICAPNSIEWAIVYLAVTATGATVSAVNPLYTSGELAHAVSHSESKYIVTVKELADVAKQAITQCPLVKEIIVFSECDGCRPLSSLLADDGLAYPHQVTVSSRDDVVALPYSSGTTGLPKGVMLTHYNLIANLQQMKIKGLAELTPDDTLLAVLPFFHIYGQIVVLLCGLKQGARVITMPKFDPEVYLNVVSEYKCNFLHVVPPIVLFLAKHPMVMKADLGSVQSLVIAAAPCGPGLMEEASGKFSKNTTFRQGYGMTEASPATHMNPEDPSQIRLHTVGPAIPNTEFKVVDIETGDILGKGKEGELCIRGPQVMKGYFKNPKATDQAIIDGFLHTGDIGYYDDMGHAIVTDRLKELIKVKGFQVAPAELEALLVTHPAIQDAAVIGKPDGRAGELPRAYVVKTPNQNISAEEVQNFVKAKLASFKHLDGGIEFVKEIPKAASGKILRRVLKEELLNKS